LNSGQGKAKGVLKFEGESVIPADSDQDFKALLS